MALHINCIVYVNFIHVTLHMKELLAFHICYNTCTLCYTYVPCMYSHTGFSQTHKIGSNGIIVSRITLRLHTSLVQLLSGDTAEMKFAILVFLYCGEFVKNIVICIEFHTYHIQLFHPEPHSVRSANIVHIYHPPMKLWEGNVFPPVCLSTRG